MEPLMAADVVAALVFVCLVSTLGYLGQRWMGAVLLGIGAALAAGLCLGGILLAYRFGDRTVGWIGLVGGTAVAGVLVPRLLGSAVRGKSVRVFTVAWFGICILCICSYVVAGRMGLLTIALPAVIVFWITLYWFSAVTLPLRSADQRGLVFRSLVTFTLGTNYPYYFVEDGKTKERVPGNPYGQFLAGPGILFVDCDQAAYVTDGVFVKGVFGPGLNFTGWSDMIPQPIDLRPQLRAFHVEARTRDGVLVRVLVFVSYRIMRPKDRELALGGSFPFEPGVIREATNSRMLTDLVMDEASRLLKELIRERTILEIYPTNTRYGVVRNEIESQLLNGLEGILIERGLEVIHAGFGNILTQDPRVVGTVSRMWQQKIERRKAERRTQWRAAAQARLIEEIVGLVAQPSTVDSAAAAVAKFLSDEADRMRLGSTLTEPSAVQLIARRLRSRSRSPDVSNSSRSDKRNKDD